MGAIRNPSQLMRTGVYIGGPELEDLEGMRAMKSQMDDEQRMDELRDSFGTDTESTKAMDEFLIDSGLLGYLFEWHLRGNKGGLDAEVPKLLEKALEIGARELLAMQKAA